MPPLSEWRTSQPYGEYCAKMLPVLYDPPLANGMRILTSICNVNKLMMLSIHKFAKHIACTCSFRANGMRIVRNWDEDFNWIRKWVADFWLNEDYEELGWRFWSNKEIGWRFWLNEVCEEAIWGFWGNGICVLRKFQGLVFLLLWGFNFFS